MPNALERRFPDLDLPRAELGAWPTPAERLGGLDLPPGVLLSCKREDLAGTIYGGNKVRKLEYLLAHARRHFAALGISGGDLATVGAVGSHHVLATCLYGHRQGLRTHALLVPHPSSDHTRDNARLIAAHAASTWPTSHLGVPWTAWRLWSQVRRATGHAPYLVTAGGSSPVGTLGHVALGLEIAEDVAAGRIPEPSSVYVALGSGGTAAGILVGVRLAGLDAEVVAVRVVARALSNGTTLLRLARRTAALLPERPALRGLRVVHSQIGRGYGHDTPEARRARELAWGRQHLLLEETYSSKAFAACLADLAAGRGGRTPLFVNTVSSRPLDSLLANAPAELPPALVRLLR